MVPSGSEKSFTRKLPNLIHFPSDAVHLQVVLERHPKKLLHTATLTLRVPSNILHSEKSAPDIISAFDSAVKALLRELQSLKADLRRERFWKRKDLLVFEGNVGLRLDEDCRTAIG